MSTFRAFTHACGSLTVQDHGSLLRGKLRWKGPLDSANQEEAISWLRDRTRELGKPLLLDTRTGQVLLFAEAGKIQCKRLLERKRIK